MIITEVMAPSSFRHKRQNLGAVAGAPDLSLRLKFSEIVLYNFKLALVDFVLTFFYLFILSHDFCQSLALYTVYSKKKKAT